MTIPIVLTLAVVFSVIVGIMWFRYPADLALLGGLTILLLYGMADPQFAFTVDVGLQGFAKPGVLTVAVLFVVADGLQRTGAFAWLGMRLLGTPTGIRSAQVRTMLPAAFLSAFLNNTTVVILMMPIISDWSRKHRISVSHLFMPLSFAAILGGMCTLIGTSTTLLVNGELQDGLSMFELAWIGIPATLIGIAFLAFGTPRILPERQPAFTTTQDPREYTVEMLLDPASPLVGKSIEEAGLRSLPGVYLMEIDRKGRVLPAVGSQTILQPGDQLVFVGVVGSVVDLQKIPGLKPATDQLFKLDEPPDHRCLVEAVVSTSYPFLRRTVRESRFRSTYNAAIIAVNRDGARLPGKIGDIRLEPGDTLLLESTPSFIEQQKNSRHFFLVSEVANSAPVRHEKAWVARAIMAGFIVGASAFSWFGHKNAALLAALPAALMMIFFRCTRAGDARRSIDWNVILVMGAGLGIGQAMTKSGATELILDALHRVIAAAGGGHTAMLACIFVAAVCLTNMITAKAAAALLLDVALQASSAPGISQKPFVIALIIGCAASFATPFGYQTNMMVYGPGGYRSSDYLRLGVPLSILIGIVTVLMVPWVWPIQA